jgi:Flp pilus assembly protein TadB
MKQDWLLPHTVRRVGWWIFLTLLLSYLAMRSEAGQQYLNETQSWINYNETVINIFIIGLAVGLILIAFSREKTEDEMIQKLRLQALQWSVYANYAVLILCSLLFYFVDFLNVLIMNMYTILIVFIIIFRWTIYRMNREAAL